MLKPSTVTRFLRAAGNLGPQGGFDDYCVVEVKGILTLCGQTINDHPWKDYEFSKRPICQITQDELGILEVISALDLADERAARAEKDCHDSQVVAWQKGLAGRKFGGFVVENGFFCDEFGNLIERLPNEIRTDAELERAASALGDDFIE